MQAIYRSTAHARDVEIAGAAAELAASDKADAQYVADYYDSYDSFAKVRQLFDQIVLASKCIFSVDVEKIGYAFHVYMK